MRETPTLLLTVSFAWALGGAAGCDSAVIFGDDDDSEGILTDDDAADDDTVPGDDDAGDDDTATDDDDDVAPLPPGIHFTVIGGELAGDHDFPQSWCGYDEEDGYWLLQAGTDNHWGEGFMMAIYHEPYGPEHVEDMLFGWWGNGYGWAEATGNADCYLDLTAPLPAASGTFQCAGMLHWQSGQQVFFDIVDGTVQCP